MQITAKMVKELRDKTGAGMMDCKKALAEADGDIKKAVDVLREKGLADAAKRSTRVATEGRVLSTVSDDGQIGALVEINCETDFVAKTDDFQALASNVLNQIVANDPADVDALLAMGDGETLSEQVKAFVGKLGENTTVRRFERFATGGAGLVSSYVHMGGKIGVLVELAFDKADSAANPQVAELLHDLCLHVAAAAPSHLTGDEIDEQMLDHEREIQRNRALAEGKPEKIVDRMVEGRIAKWKKEICLVDQPFVKDPNINITALVDGVAKEVGDALTIRRFARFQLGEGLDKKESDLAAEVAAATASK